MQGEGFEKIWSPILYETDTVAHIVVDNPTTFSCPHFHFNFSYLWLRSQLCQICISHIFYSGNRCSIRYIRLLRRRSSLSDYLCCQLLRRYINCRGWCSRMTLPVTKPSKIVETRGEVHCNTDMRDNHRGLDVITRDVMCWWNRRRRQLSRSFAHTKFTQVEINHNNNFSVRWGSLRELGNLTSHPDHSFPILDLPWRTWPVLSPSDKRSFLFFRYTPQSPFSPCLPSRRCYDRFWSSPSLRCDRERRRCKPCGDSDICEYNHRRCRWNQCGGLNICTYNLQRQQYK